MNEVFNDDENTPLHPLEVGAMGPIEPFEPFEGETEAQIATWAASVRESFGKNRQQFNMAVCDALARSGTTPTPGTVLRISKWGHHTSVAADVAHWMRGLSQRFNEMEAAIPLAARQLANDLITNLFALSRAEAEKAAGVQLLALREKFDALSREYDDSLKRQAALEDVLQAKDARLTERELDMQNLQAELQVQKEAMQSAQAKIDRAEIHKKGLEAAAIEKEREHSAAIATVQASAIDAQIAAATALQKAQESAAAERRQLMQKFDNQRTLDQASAKELRFELAAAKATLESCQAELHGCSVSLARETSQREAATGLLASERSHWEVERARLESSEEKHRDLLLFAATHHRLGLTIYRDPYQDVTSLLIGHMGMSQKTAEKVVAQIEPRAPVDKGVKVDQSSHPPQKS